jgi:hypothetical protein
MYKLRMPATEHWYWLTTNYPFIADLSFLQEKPLPLGLAIFGVWPIQKCNAAHRICNAH